MFTFEVRICLLKSFPNPFVHRLLAADRVLVSDIAQRRHLRSAAGHQLVVPSYQLNTWPTGVFCTRSDRVELFA